MGGRAERPEDDCDNNDDIDVEAHGKPNLRTAGTYVIKYTCTTLNGGYDAIPEKRTVIVDPDHKEHIQSTTISMQLAGLSKAEVGDMETKKLMQATAVALKTQENQMSVDDVQDCTGAEAREIDIDEANKCLRVTFLIHVVQKALMVELVARLNDIRFDDDVKADLKEAAQRDTPMTKFDRDLVKGLHFEPQVMVVRHGHHHGQR
jgi:hypothetical protein